MMTMMKKNQNRRLLKALQEHMNLLSGTLRSVSGAGPSSYLYMDYDDDDDDDFDDEDDLYGYSDYEDSYHDAFDSWDDGYDYDMFPYS